MVTKSGYLHKRSFKGHKVLSTSRANPLSHDGCQFAAVRSRPQSRRTAHAHEFSGPHRGVCIRRDTIKHKPSPRRCVDQGASAFLHVCPLLHELARLRRSWALSEQDVVNAFVSDDTRLFTASSDATIKVQLLLSERGSTRGVPAPAVVTPRVGFSGVGHGLWRASHNVGGSSAGRVLSGTGW
jgi:hypothetical protein